MSLRLTTRDFLLNAFAGESMAHMRYLIFADVAEKEKFQNVSRLFKAIAFAEFVHARNHYEKLKNYKEDFKVASGTPGGPGNTSKNLELGIMGEEYEVNEMYPTYMEVAKFQGEKAAELSFKWAYEAEKIHAQLYREAKNYVDRKEDWPLKGKVWICPVCGHTYVDNEPPEKCPICGVSKEKYIGF
ncbi:MAG: rubrerythrin family protein [Crenarchaeota archaeon]|nr:rubrerythrin family protein [Thermoproteota archaeon]MDW8034164.1 rubrerythrin family protein [Nitrososphaerota archaeon]